MLVMLVVMGVHAVAAPPETLSFQGRFLDALGTPIEDARDVVVGIYDVSTGGTPLWEETHALVPLSGGYLHLELGTVVPLPEDLFADGDRWLDVAVAGAAGRPRTRLVSVPTARVGLGLAALSAPPVACDAAAVGRVYFDTASAAIQVCDGVGWVPTHTGPVGSAPTLPAASCLDVLTHQPGAASGPYWIDVGGTSVRLYCDMTPGDAGWTLIGQIDGRHEMANTWLRSNTRTDNLATLAIEAGTWSSVDAVDLAVNRASEVRLSNGDASRWVRWPMDPGRTVATWWNHAAGYATIDAASDQLVTVTGSSGSSTCYQNAYGIQPFSAHGGGYPAASVNTAGNTSGGDWCMAVGVTTLGADGFTQNGNGYDAPPDDVSWPNPAYNVDPHLSVWVR